MKLIIYFLILFLIANREKEKFVSGKRNEAEFKYFTCPEIIEYYHDCIHLETLDESIEQTCTIYYSKKCQNLYTMGIEGIPQCLSLKKQMKRKLNLTLKSVSISMKLLCTKADDHQFCPLSEPLYHNGNIIFYPKDDHQLQIFQQFLNETCYSEKCIDAYYAYEDGLRDLSKEITSLNSTIELLQESTKFLRSMNCTNISVYPKFEIVNSINKYSSVLIVVLGLLLSILI
eukprot:jgi/Orpsp1_1/1175796/evm.model.c7180000055228.1